MICLKLDANDALNLYGLLIKSGENKISSQIHEQFVEIVNTHINNKKLSQMNSWIRNQISKIEELKNDSK